MEFNDEQILSVDDYEKIAKAYASALKSKGFMIVQINEENNKELVHQIFEELYTIKSLLFSLGGFLNTSKFYSLNERQLKKLAILFDFDQKLENKKVPSDKTKGLLAFLSTELMLIKHLFELIEKTNYEVQLKDIINSRLTLLSQILQV